MLILFNIVEALLEAFSCYRSIGRVNTGSFVYIIQEFAFLVGHGQNLLSQEGVHLLLQLVDGLRARVRDVGFEVRLHGCSFVVVVLRRYGRLLGSRRARRSSRRQLLLRIDKRHVSEVIDIAR